MFNLFRSRDRLVRIMLSAVLLIVALSMVTYLIPSYGNTDRGPDSVVAEIGKETITAHDIQARVQEAIQAHLVPTDMVSLYLPQIVDEVISFRAMIYEAKRLGLRVSDEDTSTAIRMSRPDLFPEGKFVGREAYAAALAQQNLTIPEFESQFADNVLISRLTQIVVEGTVVTPGEVEQEYRRLNDKVKVEFVKIDPQKLQSAVTVTPAEVKEYYDKNQGQFPVPEKRSLAILMLDPAKIEQSIQISDAELRSAYEGDKEKFRNPERVLSRHILIKGGTTPEEDAKAKAKAEDILKQLKAGADFAELAKKNSQDPGSAFKGGDLGWLVRGQTVKPFEEAAFALKPKQLSDPIKTQFGYHIIEVLEHQQPHLATFEEARAQLADGLRKERVGKLIEDLSDRAESALKKEPAEKVATALNLAPPVIAENIGPGDPIPGVGANKDLQQGINGLQKGQVSPPVSLPGNRIALAVVTAVTPARSATFEEAQARIRSLLESQKAIQLSSQRASDLVSKVNAMNGDLEKAAKSMGLEVQKPAPFDRAASVEGLGSAAYFSEAFTKPDGTILGPLAVPQGRVIAKVLEKVPADMSLLPAQRAGLVAQLRGKKARERNQLFAEGVREQLIKEGKLKIHKKVVDQLAAAYRG
jgi:peptidyl-prolyl cis-trans isomerase D